MKKKLCIHGHFYQPPREDPWFGKIFLEASAAPRRHWNERITRESYAPLAWSRRLDGEGKIADLVNCYEWINFNIGPTLMLWLEREEPALLARIQEADRRSLARWGHGNAIAQIFHHIIMPLASELDKEVEVAWALADFEARFNRRAEGIWLSECAADMASLEAVARQGIKFVVLSPHQAKSVRRPGGIATDVNARTLNIGKPYNMELPSGRKMAAFFYEADLAQSVAFEGLLSDGEKFWQKLSSTAARLSGDAPVLTLATDGETYGHHFTFGEMALAYVLAQGYSGRDGVELTNFASYLEEYPPDDTVILHEPSSWSCTHGVERWRSDCGDTTGGHSGWNQKWRAPLREALDFMKKNVDQWYFERGGGIFGDSKAALLEYGKILVNPALGHEFMDRHLKAPAARKIAWQLLRMQESALSSYASCAWFFDEISRIEPVNALRFMLRTLDIMKDSGGPDIQGAVEAILAKAVSNKPEEGNGKNIFIRRVLPSRQDPARLCLFCCLYARAAGELHAPGQEYFMQYPRIEVRLNIEESGADGTCAGRARVTSPETREGMNYTWHGVLPGPGALTSFAGAQIQIAEDNGSYRGSCKGEDLAPYLQAWLGLGFMQRMLETQHAQRLSAALQIVSTVQALEEGQNAQNLSQKWSQFAPYIPLAVYTGPITPEKLPVLREILRQNLCGYESQQLARDFLEAAVSADLQGGKSDEAISLGIRRVNAVFEHTDWWNIQNALWSGNRTNPAYAATAAELGFSKVNPL